MFHINTNQPRNRYKKDKQKNIETDRQTDKARKLNDKYHPTCHRYMGCCWVWFAKYVFRVQSAYSVL